MNEPAPTFKRRGHPRSPRPGFGPGARRVDSAHADPALPVATAAPAPVSPSPWACSARPCLRRPPTPRWSALRFDPAKVKVGRVYQYREVQPRRLAPRPGLPVRGRAGSAESLKWDDEVGWATFVVAEMDWTRFSVRRFESYDLRKGKAPLLKATLDTDAAGAVSISVLPGPPLKLTTWPWHSYDFDWASLGATLPHLVKPRGSAELQPDRLRAGGGEAAALRGPRGRAAPLRAARDARGDSDPTLRPGRARPGRTRPRGRHGAARPAPCGPMRKRATSSSSSCPSPTSPASSTAACACSRWPT